MKDKNSLFTEITVEEDAKVNGGGFFDFLNKILKDIRKPNPDVFQKPKYK
jgi:hypothetical protein